MDQYERILEQWRSKDISTETGLDKYLNGFHILFAYHSGKIENEEIDYQDTRDIFENGMVSNFTGNPRALLEQQNQKLCYEFLKSKVVKREPLSLGLVREIHRSLTGGTYDGSRYIENDERPGEFKKHTYIIGKYEVGSSYEYTENEVAELLAELNEYGGSNYLKAAAYFHARFEFIHPFADGSGRVGRTLMNYYLMTHGHPPLIIYDEDKRRYFECLEKYDATEDIKPLYNFLKYQTEKTWSNNGT